ncbi:MAG: hypothetical protein SGI94_16755 [Saprospiraceae bacterium]|nr:hypothetical protein [Saprospiraceae bacterium]
MKKLVAECMLLVAIFFAVATLAMGQCPPLWEISNDCGDIQANGGLAPGPIIFCEGIDIFVENNSTPANQITKTYIDWGDGTICQSFPNCPPILSHAYDFPNDTCIGGTGLLTFIVRLGVEKTCGNSSSFHYNTFPIAVRFKPVAELAVSPQTACVNTPVDFLNNSCPNANNPGWLWTINGQTYTTEEVLD